MVDEALAGQRCEQNLDLNGRHYQIIANPVAESENRWGAVVVILDVTEQQNREGLRREFTANVSHELKTPLTSISGYAEIMKNGLVPAAGYGAFFRKNLCGGSASDYSGRGYYQAVPSDEAMWSWKRTSRFVPDCL